MDNEVKEQSEVKRIPLEEFQKEMMPLSVRFVYEMGIVFISLIVAGLIVAFMVATNQRV